MMKQDQVNNKNPMKPELYDDRVKFISLHKEEDEDVNIQEADIVVSGGGNEATGKLRNAKRIS